MNSQAIHNHYEQSVAYNFKVFFCNTFEYSFGNKGTEEKNNKIYWLRRL